MTDDLIARLRCYPANRLCRQVADALEAQARRIAELEADIDRDDEWAKGFIEKTDARIAELEAALKDISERHIPDQPSACGLDEIDYVRKHYAELRRAARAAYRGEKND